MEELMIRKAGPEDVDGIETLYHASIDWLRDQGICQWKQGVYPTRSTAEEAITEGSLFGYFSEDHLAASFILNEHQPACYEPLDWQTRLPALVLHTLAVHPAMTGRGIGRAIMAFILDYGREKGYHSIRLDAFPGNRAATALYHSLGFSLVGQVRFDYKEPGYEWYDCYEKSL